MLIDFYIMRQEIVFALIVVIFQKPKIAGVVPIIITINARQIIDFVS